MKKKLILLLLVTIFSCDIEGRGNELPNFSLQVMFIESVDIPTEFNFGQSHEITVNYTRPNGCHEFNDFIFQPEGNTRTVAVVDTVYLDEDCAQAEEAASVSFTFVVSSLDTYIFQFYQGVDNNGEDMYLIVEVPVVQ